MRIIPDKIYRVIEGIKPILFAVGFLIPLIGYGALRFWLNYTSSMLKMALKELGKVGYNNTQAVANINDAWIFMDIGIALLTVSLIIGGLSLFLAFLMQCRNNKSEK